MKKIGILISTLAILALPVFQISQPLNAQESSVQESVGPDNATNYFFKRLGEKINAVILTPFPNKKADLYQELVRKRKSELSYIAKNKKLDLIQKASQRYAAQVGVYAEYVKNKNLETAKQNALAFLEGQVEEVKMFRENFSDQTSEWRFMVEDYDYLQSYINLLK